MRLRSRQALVSPKLSGMAQKPTFTAMGRIVQTKTGTTEYFCKVDKWAYIYEELHNGDYSWVGAE